MTTVYLKVEADRTDGKNLPASDVGEAIVAELEGAGLDVEDSQYDVTSVEVIDGPKAKTGMGDADLLDLDIAFRAFSSAFPVRLDPEDPDPYANLNDAQRMFVLAFSKLAFSPQVGDAILKAKVRAAKKPQSETDKALSKAVKDRYKRT